MELGNRDKPKMASAAATARRNSPRILGFLALDGRIGRRMCAESESTELPRRFSDEWAVESAELARYSVQSWAARDEKNSPSCFVLSCGTFFAPALIIRSFFLFNLDSASVKSVQEDIEKTHTGRACDFCSLPPANARQVPNDAKRGD